MKILIVGAGEIGTHLAQNLSLKDHEVSVLEKDPALCAELEAELDVKVVCGNGEHISDLADADVGEAEVFLAMTAIDSSNLVAARIAKQLGVPQVLARVHPAILREQWLFDYRTNFHADHLISPQRLTALELAKYILNPETQVIEEFARGRIELQQIVLGETSTALGKTVRSLSPPKEVRIALVKSQHQTFVPEADTVLLLGNELTVLGEPRELRKFIGTIHGPTRHTVQPRVAIFGGNDYAFTLAELLEGSPCRVRIFEKDPRQCEKLAGILSQTTIVQGDASLRKILEEEEIDQVDWFVAATGHDEDNALACLQAKMVGASKALAIIHRADYAAMISEEDERFGIHAAVSPREATEREIQRFVTSNKYHTIRSFGDVKMIELQVRENAVVTGGTIKSVS